MFLKKFNTHEDKYHMHKTFGILSLGHFIYRFVNIVMHKQSGLQDSPWTPFFIYVHGALSATSLFFHLPSNRVTKRPVIYPEFRLHSIIFAFRSLFAMANLYFWPTAQWPRAVGALVTLACADFATAYYNVENQPTTMRGMPFDDRVPPWVRSHLNFFYSFSQILATMNTIISRNIDAPFLVLFPIQIAAFLMTCVKKGYLSTNGWHALYTAALLLNYARALYITDLQNTYNYWRVVMIFALLRFEFKVNKYLLWLGVILLASKLA